MRPTTARVLIFSAVCFLLAAAILLTLPACSSPQSAYLTKARRMVNPDPPPTAMADHVGDTNEMIPEILPSHAEARVIVVDPHARRGNQ